MADLIDKAAVLALPRYEPTLIGVREDRAGMEPCEGGDYIHAAAIAALPAQGVSEERPFIMGANHGYETAMEQVAEEARRYARMYDEGSDGRNTFTLFAEWAEQAAFKPAALESAEAGGVEAHVNETPKSEHDARDVLTPAPVDALVKAAGLRFTGLHPTPFGDMIGIEGYPPETMMLVSVCGASGIKPVRCILWHQLYTKDLPALEEQGEVVICAVPYATNHFSLTAALTTENQTNG